MFSRIGPRAGAGLAALAFAWSVFPAIAANAQDLVGVATVVDGDTLEIHGRRIRLHGMDAPESNQTCVAGSAAYRCGQKSALALSDRIDRSPVTCRGKDVDRYGRIVAVCYKDGEDLNAWMVSQGWAVAYRQYSKDYVGQEAAAQASSQGIWAGQFVVPSEWRRGKRLENSAAPAVGGSCRIKGNISSKGKKIYHVPGGRWYERTRISPASGERMFCSENEAVAAGWRKSSQ